jgi:hypothetical protein
MTAKRTEPTPDDEPQDTPPPAAARIDADGLQATRKSAAAAELDNEREVPVWEADDAPAGSTASSLLVYERGKPVRVQGPTHYHHLADGRVGVGYNGGTHHTEPGEDGGPDKVTKILAVHEG